MDDHQIHLHLSSLWYVLIIMSEFCTWWWARKLFTPLVFSVSSSYLVVTNLESTKIWNCHIWFFFSLYIFPLFIYQQTYVAQVLQDPNTDETGSGEDEGQGSSQDEVVVNEGDFQSGEDSLIENEVHHWPRQGHAMCWTSRTSTCPNGDPLHLTTLTEHVNPSQLTAKTFIYHWGLETGWPIIKNMEWLVIVLQLLETEFHNSSLHWLLCSYGVSCRYKCMSSK